MTTPTRDNAAHRIAELEGLLRDMLGLHRELQRVIEAKLAGMRRSDALCIQHCVESEGHLIQDIQRLEAMRQCLIQHLARELGWPVNSAGSLTLGHIAERVETERAHCLRQLGADLGEVLQEVGRANGRAAAVARQMQSWHRMLVQEATGAFNTTTVYSRNGYAWRPAQAQVIDTTY